MQYYNYSENKQRGTFDFPFELYHVDSSHARYVMSYHWHVEYEIIRILEGSLHVTMDEKDFIAEPGDIVFVNSGVLHSGEPLDCIYQCLVFDLNAFQKQNARCSTYIQKILDHSAFVYHHFTSKNEQVHQVIWNIFEAMEGKKNGYEMIVVWRIVSLFWSYIFPPSVFFRLPPGSERLSEGNAIKKSSGLHGSQLCLFRDLRTAFLLRSYVTEIFLPFFLSDDTPNSYRLSELSADRTRQLPACHHGCLGNGSGL